MIQLNMRVLKWFGGRLSVWLVSMRAIGIWLSIFGTLCLSAGCSGKWEHRRNERKAVAQRATLPPSQQEALAGLKDCIPEHLFIHRVTIRNDTVTKVVLDPNVKDSHLAAVEKLPDLEALACGGREVTDAGLIHLKTLRKLRVLSLPHTVTGPGLAHLKELPELREVNFYNGYRVTDDTLVHLSYLANLQTIRIPGALISDEGLKQLSSLKRLRLLNITRCHGVTDKGLSYVAEFPFLRQLYVRDTGMTDAGISRFRRAKPECKVVTEFER